MDVKKRNILSNEKMKIVKLKVKKGTMIYDGSILLIYESTDNKDDGIKQKKLKSTDVGIVKKICVRQGDVISPGSVIIELEKECNHPTVIKDLCAECGADLQKENAKDGNQVSQASVSMVHMVPELKVNDELAQILGKADMDRLLAHRKLVLLVDLDQTLIHTTNDNIPNNIKDVCHFQLYGSRSPWYHTRLRPGTHTFLEGISKKYELHICTFGSRRYAHMIARFLDPDGKFFSHRILSRDECFDPNSKTANLKALFPCGENMVCIIDDREDVWDYASNLIHVKPYHFFQHTGDIHAPPSVAKYENDDNKHGFDFSRFTNGLQAPNIENNDTKESGDESVIENLKEEVEKSVIENLEEEPQEIVIRNLKEESEEIVTGNLKKMPEESINNVKEQPEESIYNVEKQSEENVNIVKEKSKENVNNLNEEPEESVNNVKEDPEGNVNNAMEQPIERIDKVKLQPEESVNDVKKEPKENVKEESVQNENVLNNKTSEKEETKKKTIEQKVDPEGFVTIEETDDYLLYLEEILKIIHSEFFKRLEVTGQIPDLKQVIPQTRAKVLKGVSIAFSGIVPNRMKLEDSQAYKIARSLGAKVTQNIESDTTHLVALRAGTAKVHAAYKQKNLKLVTPEWLWTCAERWEKVDERLFTLKNAKPTIESRHPPAHCRSPEHPEPSPFTYQIPNKSNPSQFGDFLSTINPLMSLSSEDIETMEGEVEDIFKESDGEMDETFEVPEEESEDNKDNIVLSKKRKLIDNYSSSSEDENGDEIKIRRKKVRRKNDDFESFFNDSTQPSCSDDEDDENDDNKSDSDDETINSKFRRGEGLPSDLDIDYNTEEGTEDDRESDGEWNVMGAALEREFLEGD